MERLRVESHHIFPRSRLPKHPHVDSVINRVWILKRTNRDLGNRSPYDYLSQEVVAGDTNGTSSKLAERLEGQCIPLEAIEVIRNDQIEEAFAAFLDERARALLDRLVLRIGPKYVEQSSAGDEFDDYDDEDESADE